MDSEAFKQYKEYQSQAIPGGVYYIFDPPLIYFPAKFDVGGELRRTHINVSLCR
jgi:hypothetical protein